MGSIVYINKNPASWPAFDEGYTLTGCYGYEPLIKIRYGTFDDDPDGRIDLEIDMRKGIYNKLLEGRYKVSRDHLRDLRILDENNNVIEPIRDGTIY